MRSRTASNEQLYALALATGFLGVGIHLVFTRLEARALRWHRVAARGRDVSPRAYRAAKIGAEIAVPIAILVAWQLWTVHLHSTKFPRLSTILVEFQRMWLFSSSARTSSRVSSASRWGSGSRSSQASRSASRSGSRAGRGCGRCRTSSTGAQCRRRRCCRSRSCSSIRSETRRRSRSSRSSASSRRCSTRSTACAGSTRR